MYSDWVRVAVSHPVFTGISRPASTGLLAELREPWATKAEGQRRARRGRERYVFAYADQHGVRLRMDGTEIQVRGPAAGRPGRRTFVSGKRKQNTMKFTMITSETGRVLWTGAPRPGRMHDQTAVRTEGIAEQLRLYPNVRVLVDAGYRGLVNQFPGQVIGPPKRPTGTTPPENITEFEQARKTQSSERISVEHDIAETKAWRSLQRWIGKHEYRPETVTAIAALASDRASAA